jgi:hypothetical protein
MTEIEEYERCLESPEYFMNEYLWLQDPITFETIKLSLEGEWSYLTDVLHEFLDTRLLIILKSRQLGISTLCAAYALWTAMFRTNANILLLSKRETEAQRLMGKIKFMRDHLPGWLLPRLLKDTESKMTFTGDSLGGGKFSEGSTIIVLPATEDAGRSETASIVICDEWAFHPFAERNYSAFKPTVDAGGQVIGLSTANGIGNLFYKLYAGAKKHDNNFKHLFLPWHLRPGRDEQWYEERKREYSFSLLLLNQEYPTNDIDAFIMTSESPFDADAVRFYLDNVVKDPLPKGNLPTTLQTLAAHEISVWELPQPRQQYVIGADPAEGIGQDKSEATVWDIENTQVCKISGQFDPDQFARILNLVGHVYNQALIAVERNNHGHSVLNVLCRYLNYPRVYKHYAYDQKLTRKIYKAGYPTNVKEKAIMMADIVAAVREKDCIIRDREFFEQATIFGQPKEPDDAVIANAVVLQALKSPQARGKQKIKVSYSPIGGYRGGRRR